VFPLKSKLTVAGLYVPPVTKVSVVCGIPVRLLPSPYNVPPDIVVADNTFILAVNAVPRLSVIVKVLISSYLYLFCFPMGLLIAH